jgi:hypothetical protein
MRLLAAKILLILLSGCATTGIERTFYPVSDLNIVFVGKVVDYEPFRGDLGGETKASRAAWGFLAFGVIGAVVSASSDPEIGKTNAKIYHLRNSIGQVKNIVSLNDANLSDCVEVFKSPDDKLHSINKVNDDKCK